MLYKTSPLTLLLIVICVLLAAISSFGKNIQPLLPFYMSAYTQGLSEIQSGQLWRLVTPIFLHFGILHLVFNMLWLYQLGGAIETRQSKLFFGLLVLVLAISSNLAQYWFAGSNFGGMSGVVYGLLGYFWQQGVWNPRFGMRLEQPVVIMMAVWFVLCWLGVFGPIANMAHTGGLVLGVLAGFVLGKLHVPG